VATSGDDEIQRAVELLKAGRLVAFPTETVYGLGADAMNPEAVARIFQAKGRPSTNPLIAHIADAQTARQYVRDWPDEAQWLAQRFWPGPLTIILPKPPAGPARIPGMATAGRDTVALRVPSHPIALELLRRFGRPIAAPSANRSTRVSPTTAQHVRDELGDSVDLILDGGPCDVGIESTVIDLSVEPPTILRPGSITRVQIEAEIGPITVFAGSVDPKLAAASPGQHSVHYAPRAEAYRFDTADWPLIDAIESRGAAFLIPGKTMPDDPAKYARILYRELRRLDEQGTQTIYIEMPPDTPEWAAVRDRLNRATKPLPPGI
jgi:L-threonylcarbamoyladenylate synthase